MEVQVKKLAELLASYLVIVSRSEFVRAANGIQQDSRAERREICCLATGFKTVHHVVPELLLRGHTPVLLA